MTKPPPTEPPDLAAMRATLARAWADAARSKPVLAADGRALGDPARHARAVAQALRLTAAIEREERAGRIERQKIGIARRQLGIPDDSHSARVHRLTNGRTRTTCECTAAERRAILDEYRDAGFQPRRAARPAARRAPPAARLQPGDMLTRVQQLLTVLGQPWSYAEAILRRQRGHDQPGQPAVASPLHLATPDQIRGVIAALDRHRRRLAAATAAPTDSPPPPPETAP